MKKYLLLIDPIAHMASCGGRKVFGRPDALLRGLLLFVILVCVGCDTFTFYDLMATGSDTGGGELRISPLSITMEVNATCLFAAKGGKPPYAFSISSGGGSIDPAAGLYTAPAEPGFTVIQVKDQDGTTKEALVTRVE